MRTTSPPRITPCGSLGSPHEAEAVAQSELLVHVCAGEGIGLLPGGRRPPVLKPGVGHPADHLASHQQHRLDVLERVDPPHRDDLACVRRVGALGGRMDPVGDHADLRRVDPQAALPGGVRLGHRRDDVGGGVRGACQTQRQTGRDVPLARCHRRLADRGQIRLADVDAVLGEQHRCPVKRLVHDRGDRRPTRCRDVQQVAGRCRDRGRARYPVQRLVEPRRLDRVEYRRRRGVIMPLAQHVVERPQELLPAVAGAKLGADDLRKLTTANERLGQVGEIARPRHQSPEQPDRKRRAGPSFEARHAARRRFLRPELDRTQQAGIGRELKALAHPFAAGDDGQDLPLHLLQAADQHLAP